jgi:hypothetical protein
VGALPGAAGIAPAATAATRAAMTYRVTGATSCGPGARLATPSE